MLSFASDYTEGAHPKVLEQGARQTMDVLQQKKQIGGRLWFAFQTLIIVQMLCVKIAVIPFDGSELRILAVLAKLRESFTEPRGLELAAAAGIFCLFCRYGRLIRRWGWRLNVLSAVFALLHTVCTSFRALESSAFYAANGYQRGLALFYFLGCFLLFRLLLTVFYELLCAAPVDQSVLPSPRGLWLRCFAILILCWLPWLSASYPASYCPDSMFQLRQYFGILPWSSHHPPLSTAIMGMTVSLGALIKNRNFGVLLYVCLQTVTGAAVFSTLLLRLRQSGCGRRCFLAALLFYALVPIWGVYSQWFEKDFLYAQFYVICVLLLMDVQSSGCTDRRTVAASLLLVLTLLLRNNAVYELLPYALLLCCCLRGKDRKNLLIGIAAAVVIFLGVSRLLYPALGIEKGSVAEALSVPFQQTARYVSTLPEEVTDEEREAIDAVLDYEKLPSTYVPRLSDSVKVQYHGDEKALKQYFQVWFSMGVKHPTVYLDAFVHQAYGYLAPVIACGEPNIPLAKNGFQEIEDLGLSRNTRLIPTVLMDVYWSTVQRLPVVKLLISAGFYSWMVLACTVFLFIRKKRAAVLPLIPALINILVCAASPMHASIRYDLTTIALAPLLLWWTAMHGREASA